MRFRHHHNQISQGDREYAENNWREYGAILGLNHQGEAKGIDRNVVLYLHKPVADEATPTQLDIQEWVDFGLEALKSGRNLLCHCEAGQNRSLIVSSLIQSRFERRSWWSVVEEYHAELLKEEPPHNWWPYEHWYEVIYKWLIEDVARPPSKIVICQPTGPIPLDDALDLAGGQRLDYLTSLYRYCHKLPKPATVVEIGCYYGASTIVMASALRGSNSRVITIDPVFTKGEIWCMDVHHRTPGCYKSSAVDLLNRLNNAGLASLVAIVPDYSWRALEKWPGEQITMFFCDGEHSVEAVRADCEWLNLVKPGGFAVFDDWLHEISSTVMGWMEHHPEWTLLHTSTDAPTEEYCVTIFQKAG